jgi:hypothetical protein
LPSARSRFAASKVSFSGIVASSFASVGCLLQPPGSPNTQFPAQSLSSRRLGKMAGYAPPRYAKGED